MDRLGSGRDSGSEQGSKAGSDGIVEWDQMDDGWMDGWMDDGSMMDEDDGWMDACMHECMMDAWNRIGVGWRESDQSGIPEQDWGQLDRAGSGWMDGAGLG